MKNILVPVDFSPVTLAVMKQAEAMARCVDGKLWVIHVAAPDPDFVGLDIGPKHVRDWRAAQLREEHRGIQTMALELEERGLDVTPMLVQGPTVELLLNEADKLGIDMIIMGSHGHGALYNALVGTVSEGVLHKAKCPVLIVPSDASAKE
jgi:nucleotide-binding universal stress UspA family protein